MQKNQIKSFLSARGLVYCALLAALSIILARFIVPMPNETTRFSIEAVPIFLAGMLFGPLPGGLVGVTADAIGALASGYGPPNPLLCIPPLLYGVCGGLFRWYLNKGVTIPRLIVSFLPPIVLGSILYQSAALALVYSPDTFLAFFLLKLGTRSIQFTITMVIDILVIYLLFKAKLFEKLGIWPLNKKGKSA